MQAKFKFEFRNSPNAAVEDRLMAERAPFRDEAFFDIVFAPSGEGFLLPVWSPALWRYVTAVKLEGNQPFVLREMQRWQLGNGLPPAVQYELRIKPEFQERVVEIAANAASFRMAFAPPKWHILLRKMYSHALEAWEEIVGKDLEETPPSYGDVFRVDDTLDAIKGSRLFIGGLATKKKKIEFRWLK